MFSQENAQAQAAGTILAIDKQGVYVACGDEHAVC